MKRKTIAALLIIAMIMGLSAPAYAEDIPDDAEPPQTQDQPQEPQEETPVVVSTLEELQAAIADAEDGDTIAINSAITVDGGALTTDKSITLVRTEEYAQISYHMIILKNGASLSGFEIIDSGVGHRTVNVDESVGEAVTITNCTFSAAKDFRAESYIHCARESKLSVVNCTFNTGNGYSIYGQPDTQIIIDSCTFQRGHYFSWFLICVDGNTTVQNCTFSEETGYIVTSVFGNLTITNCDFQMNIANGRVYPNIYIGGKDLSGGTLNLSDTPVDGEGYYDLFKGEKVELPLSDCEDQTILAYMTDEYAEQYFQIEGITNLFPFSYDGRNEIDEPEDEDTDTDTDEPTDPPTTPDEPEDSDGGENDDTPEQQPTQPPADDDGSEETPEQPTQPEEPEDNDNSEDDTNTPVEPSEPPQDEDSPDDENTPPVIYRPPYRPTRPIAPDPEPEDPVEPEPTPTLVCGEAAIDVSRSVVLQGYGDGDLHLEDSLTRAQLATIIYRLLDDESIAELSIDNGQQFTDVDPDMWCYEYVQIIARAGIVYGVGGGNYDPSGTVTWAQVLTVLSRFVPAQDYTLQYITYDGWALSAVQTAVALGWITDSAEFSPDAVISRGALVQLVNGILEQYRD